nr:reverse transcriptase domain-containing protein [Tanacetum cinerariifolium]
MPFGLKNAGATYQRLVDKAVKKKIGRNLEVYVDDLVIESRTEQKIIRDIKEMFKTLRKINMKLNPKKCTFRVETANTNRTYGKRGPDCVPYGSTRSRERSVNDRKGDFIVERLENNSVVTTTEAEEELSDPWTLFTDGSSCIDGSRAGLILKNPEGTKFTYALRIRFDATNSEADYEALIAGLRIAEQMGIKNLQANVDSRLVASQVNESFITKESGMIQYLEKVKTLASSFKNFSIKQVPRSENKKAGALSKIMSTSFAHLTKQVLVEELHEKYRNEEELLAVVKEEGDTWMTPIYEYLTKETLLAEKEKARVVRRKSRWSSNGDTSFSLTYGMKAVIPAKISMPTSRTSEIDMVQNDEALEINIDLLEERKEQAAIRKARSKAKMKNITTSKFATQASS